MVDVRRTIDVEINVTGANIAQLTTISRSFDTVGVAIQKTIGSIDSFRAQLESLTTPPGLSKFAKTLKKFEGIKVPNLKQIAEGFERLAKISSPPNLGAFATEVKKFDGIKVPNIKNLAVGIELLSSSTLRTEKAAKRLRILHRNLKRFSEIKVPNIKTLADSVTLLSASTLGIGKAAANLRILYRSLKRFSEIKIPSISGLVTGLRRLADLNIAPVSAKLQALVPILLLFKDIKLPSLLSFANGLKRLGKIKINKIAQKLKTLNKALRSLDKAGHLQSFANFARNLNQISRPLATASKSLDRYSASANTAARNTRTFGERIKTYLQYRLISDSVIALHTAMVDGFTIIKEYSQALKDLQAITGATTVEVAQMGTKIKQVASLTKFSASEVAAGMRTLGQAGFSASDSIESMQAVSDLATGTLAELSNSVDLITTAMRVFQFDASQSSKVADTFANAVNKSKLTIDKLRIAMNYVGPIAKRSGATFHEMAAGMMTLANSGLRASTIGTGLRRVFAELADPSDKFAEAADRAGVSLSDLNIKTHGLHSVLISLGLIISDTDTAFDLFGKRGAAAALTLTQSGGAFTGMLDVVGTTGSAARMAAIQMEGLGVSFKNLRDKLGLLVIALGEAGLITVFKIFVDVAREVVDVITSMINHTLGRWILQTGFVTVAVVALVAAMALLSMAFLALKSPAVIHVLATLSATIHAAAVGMVGYGTATLGAAGAQATLTGAVKATTVSFAAMWSAVWPIVALVAGFVAVAFAIRGLVVGVNHLTTSAQRNSDAALKLADAYRSAGKVVQDYKIIMHGLDATSAQALENNKGLRKRLLEVAIGTSELADEAMAAISSISAMTGEIDAGSDALARFYAESQKIKRTQLAETLTEGFRALEQQTGRVARSLHKLRDFHHRFNLVAAVREHGAAMDALMTGREVPEDAFTFAAALNAGKRSWEVYTEYVKVLMNKLPAELSRMESTLIVQFEARSRDARRVVLELGKAGYDTGIMTTEGMVAAAHSIGLLAGATELAIEAVISEFDKIVAVEGFDNLIENWAQGTEKSKHSIKELTKIVRVAGGVFSEENQKRLVESREAHARFVLDRQVIIDTYKVIQEGKAKAQIVGDLGALRRFTTQETALLREANELRMRFTNETIAGVTVELDKLTANYKVIVAKLQQEFAAGSIQLVNALVHQEAQFASHVARLFQLVDPTKVVVASRKALDGKEVALKEHLHNIAMLEATGELSHEKAEARKAKGTRDSLAAMAALAKATHDKLAGLDYGDDAELERARKDSERAHKKYLDRKKKDILGYSKAARDAQAGLVAATLDMDEDRIKSEKNVSEMQREAINERIASNTDYVETRGELERELKDKIISVNADLAEKLTGFRAERVQAEKDAQADIIGLNDTLADRLTKLNQRYMGEWQKQTDNRRRADQKLHGGMALIESARKTGDEAVLERGRKFIAQAGSLFVTLDNTSVARAGIIEVYAALADAREVEEKHEKAAIDEKILKEQALANEKIKNAKAVNAQVLKNLGIELNKNLSQIDIVLKTSLNAEKIRHAEVMRNIAIEANEYTRLHNLAKGHIDATLAPQAPQEDGMDARLAPGRLGKLTVPTIPQQLPQEAPQMSVGLDETTIAQTNAALEQLRINAAYIPVDTITEEDLGFPALSVSALSFGDHIRGVFWTIGESFKWSSRTMFADWVMGVRTAEDAFKGFVHSVLQGLGEMVAKMLIAQISKAFGGGGGGGGGGGLMGKLGGWVSGLLGFAEGGKIGGSSPHDKADNIPILATAGEFVQPVRAVRHFGVDFMESIRTLKFPKQVISGITSLPSILSVPSAMKFAAGGLIPSQTNRADNINVQTGETHLKVVNILDKDLMGGYLDSVEGEFNMINFISRNRSAIQGILR